MLHVPSIRLYLMGSAVKWLEGTWIWRFLTRDCPGLLIWCFRIFVFRVSRFDFITFNSNGFTFFSFNFFVRIFSEFNFDFFFTIFSKSKKNRIFIENFFWNFFGAAFGQSFDFWKYTGNESIISLKMNESDLLWKRAKRIMSHLDGAMTNDDSFSKAILENWSEILFSHSAYDIYRYFQTDEIVKWLEFMI